MKYIDAEKLKERISRLRDEFVKKSETKGYTALEYLHKAEGLSLALQHIDSLRQEQPEVQNGKFVFPKYLYARTKNNKTIDMSYAPQDMTAVEYIRNDFIEQEQQDVDLEKELENFARQYPMEDSGSYRNLMTLARHFYELGKAKKEE